MSWGKIKIGSFLKERTGRFKPSEANKMGLKRVEKIDFSGTYHLVNKVTNTDMILVKKGDLLISGINAEKGAVAIYNDDEDALATIHYSSYEFDKSKINIEYFKWFLISDAFKNLLKETAGNGIKTELKSKHLLPLEIHLPSLKQQVEIVKKINREHSVVKNFASEIDNQQTYLQQLRQSILQEAVRGKLSEPGFTGLKDFKMNGENKILSSSNLKNHGSDNNDEDAATLLKRIKAEKQKLIKEGKLKKEKELPPITKDEIPFELPKGWVLCRLGNVTELRSGVTLGKTYKEELFAVPYLRVANVQRGFIDTTYLKTIRVPKSEIEKYNLEDGDLCMIEGGDWDKVGRCGIWNNEISPCIHQNHIFRLRFYGSISNQWSELFLNSPVARRYFESCSKQTTNLASINKTQLTSLVFVLPPLAEQQRIVAKLQKLQQHLSGLESQVQQSREYAQRLLQAVLKEAFEEKGKVYEMEDERVGMVAED